MPERFSLPFRRLSLFAVAAAVALGAACTESFDGGGACPSLCPVQQTSFRDTILEAVTLDTTLAGFPTLGLSANVLVANRPDTLVTRGILRFDRTERKVHAKIEAEERAARGLPPRA